MAFAKKPGKFVKGDKVVVKGKTCTVVHEFGGEDVGWLLVKFPNDTVIEVKAENVSKAADVVPVGDALCPSGLGAPHEFKPQMVAGFASGRCDTCGATPSVLAEAVKKQKEQMHADYTANEIAASKRVGGGVGYSSKRGKDSKETEYKGWHIVSNGFGNWTAYAPDDNSSNGPGQMSGSLGQLKKRIDGYAKAEDVAPVGDAATGSKLAKEESKGSQAEYKKTVAESNARAGIVKPVADEGVVNWKRADPPKKPSPLRNVLNKEDLAAMSAKGGSKLRDEEATKKCKRCKGTGHLYIGGAMLTCPPCKGHGKVAVANDVQPVGKTVAEVRADVKAYVDKKYSAEAVQKEINKDKRIGGKKAKAIHALLKGRTGDADVIEEYRGYKILRGKTGAVSVSNLGMRDRYFRGFTEKSAVEAAKKSIEKYEALPKTYTREDVFAKDVAPVGDAAEYRVVSSCMGDVDGEYDVQLRTGEKLTWLGGESNGSLFKRANGEEVMVSKSDMDKGCVTKTGAKDVAPVGDANPYAHRVLVEEAELEQLEAELKRELAAAPNTSQQHVSDLKRSIVSCKRRLENAKAGKWEGAKDAAPVGDASEDFYRECVRILQSKPAHPPVHELDKDMVKSVFGKMSAKKVVEDFLKEFDERHGADLKSIPITGKGANIAPIAKVIPRSKRPVADTATVRQMRSKLFEVKNQKDPASKYFPQEAKAGETVEAMRHRLFKLEPQDGAYAQAKDASPFDRDTDVGSALQVLADMNNGMKAKDIAAKYGYSLQFVLDVGNGKYGKTKAAIKKAFTSEVKPVGDTEPCDPAKMIRSMHEAGAPRATKLTTKKPYDPSKWPLKKTSDSTENKEHPSEYAADVKPVGDADYGDKPNMLQEGDRVKIAKAYGGGTSVVKEATPSGTFYVLKNGKSYHGSDLTKVGDVAPVGDAGKTAEFITSVSKIKAAARAAGNKFDSVVSTLKANKGPDRHLAGKYWATPTDTKKYEDANKLLVAAKQEEKRALTQVETAMKSAGLSSRAIKTIINGEVYRPGPGERRSGEAF